MVSMTILFVCMIASFMFVVGQNGRPAPPDIACSGHPDGLYVTNPNACTDGFYKCANGRSFYYRCPSGLFFSTEDAICEYKQLIPACGGTRAVKQPIVQQPAAPVANVHQLVAPAIPANPIAPIYPISYVASTAVPQQAAPIAPVQNSFEQPQQSYQQAAAPIAVQQPQYQQTTAPPAPQAPVQTTQPSTEAPSSTTPAPQYQQPQQNQAPIGLVATPSEYAVQNQQSYSQSATSPPPTAPVAPVAVQQQSQYQQASAPSAPQAPVQTVPIVDFNCGNNADGYYFKQPCTSNFYSCVGGQAIKLTCAGNTVYDPTAQSCDYADSCGKPKPASTTTQQPPSTRPASTACVGKTDGYHQKGQCQNTYLYCLNGVASDMACPSQLAFNGAQCTYVDDCMNPTSPAPIAVQSSTVAAPPRSQWCQQNGKTDGVYGHGCISKFYVCGGGFTTEINCPSGLFYDQTTGACDQMQFITACGGVRPASTTTIAAPIAPVQTVNYNCAGQSDGYKSSGCSKSYYSCTSGTATQFNCPDGTHYSPQLHTCDYSQNVPECGGQLPTTTVAAPIAPVASVIGNPAPQSYAYQTPAPSAPVAVQQPQYEQPPAPIAVQTPSANIVYNPPTVSVYPPPTTTSQQPPVYQSPAITQSPVYQPPATTQPPVYQPSATSAAPIFPVAPVQPVAPVASAEDDYTNPCQKLADGIYGRRCSRHYFVCSVNKTYEFTCPSGYAYDRQLARCGPKSGIANCSSATPVESAPQAAVVSSGYSG